MPSNDFIASSMDDLEDEGGFPDEDFMSASGEDEGFGGFGDDSGDSFGSDSGELDIDFNSADGAEAFDDQEDASNGSSNTEGNKQVLKRSLIAVGVIAACIVVVAVVIRLFSGIGDKDTGNTDNSPLNVNEPSQVESAAPQVQASAEQVQPVSTPGNRPTGGAVSNGWIVVDSDPGLQFSQPIESVFTVTNIRYETKVVEAQRTLLLKGIVTGSIDGMYGTYEADVPYDKAVNLTVGTQLFVKYILAEKNGVQYVSSIDF